MNIRKQELRLMLTQLQDHINQYGPDEELQEEIEMLEEELADITSAERRTWNAAECIRCGERPAVDDLGYCGYCHWTSHAEVERGLYALEVYLAKQRLFADWLSKHARS